MIEVQEKFFREQVDPILEVYKDKLIKNLIENEQKLENQILSSLELIANKINEDKNFKVKYIDISLPRISILNEKYEIIVSAYGENWYGGTSIDNIFTIEYVFDGLSDIRKDIYQKIKKYVGKITHHSVDYYILRQVPRYNQYLTYYFAKKLKQLDEEKSFNEMEKEEIMKIYYGEYKDSKRMVYKYEKVKKSKEQFIEALNDDKEINLIFSQWVELKADKINIANKDLTCMNLKKAKLKNIEISSCKCAGMNFRKSEMNKCYFKNCDLTISDFSEGILQDVVFDNCNLRSVDFKDAKMVNVYFIEQDKKYELKCKKKEEE